MCFFIKMVGLVFLLFLPIQLWALTVLAENGGHPGVTRSLLSGLQTLGVPFEYNGFGKIADTVIEMTAQLFLVLLGECLSQG